MNKTFRNLGEIIILLMSINILKIKNRTHPLTAIEKLIFIGPPKIQQTNIKV